MHMMPEYRPAAHHVLLARYLEEVEAGRIHRFKCHMPPRGGKSELANKRFSAWYLGRNPNRRVISASYGAQLAHRFGGQVRDQMMDPRWPFEFVHLKEDSKARHQWDIDGYRGGMLTAGRGGAITGQGGSLLNLDDMVKDREEADSPTVQDATWDWYRDTFYTRLERAPEGWPGAIVYVGTRWSDLDLGGRLDQAAADGSGDKWSTLIITAICEDEENDPLGRKLGESYWPEVFPVATLERIRRTIGERGWNALYQQRPMPAEGGILKSKWWRYWSYTGNEHAAGTIEDPLRLPEMDQTFQSWDMTFKDNKKSDYVVGQVWGVSGGNAYLLDQVRRQMDFVATKEAIIALSAKWPRAALKLVEDTANGPAIISELRSRIPGLVPVTPEGSKYARAASIAPYVESGNVILPHPTLMPWVDGLIAECAAFPNGAHDDSVDTLSQALHRAARGFEELLGGTVVWDERVSISRY
jgi:predicted phage terminase large subunit-like protein